MKKKNLSSPSGVKKGFTLIELLTVMAIIAILTVATTVALPTMLRSYNMSNAVNEVGSYLNYARAHAMGENTYVLVFFSLPDPNGHTDLQMISYSSVDGSYTPGATPGVQTSTVLHVPNISLCPITSLNSTVTGNMSGANISIDNVNTVDVLTNIGSVPKIAAPGSTVATGPNAFSELIAFSPQGEAILVPAAASSGSYSSVTPTTPFYGQIFLGLSPSRNGVSISNDANSSALILDGGTGHIVTYRS